MPDYKDTRNQATLSNFWPFFDLFKIWKFLKISAILAGYQSAKIATFLKSTAQSAKSDEISHFLNF